MRRITSLPQGKFHEQMNTLNTFINQSSAFLNSNPQFALADGPAFNTQLNSDTSTTTRSHNTTTTNTTTSTDVTFDLSINSNTIIVKGLQARNLETRLNDKLAGAGRSVSSGDRFLVMTRKGRFVDAELYQPGQADQLTQNTPDVDTKRILQAEAVGYDGENISFTDVTQDVLAQEKMERGAAEEENVAEVAGDRVGDGEYINSTKVTTRDISKFKFNKYLRKLIGPPPAGMVDPHAHHIFYKIGLGIKQKTLVKEGHAILRRYGIDPIFGKENLIWATNRVIGQHGIDDLELMVTRLREVEKFGGDYDDIVMILREFGRRAVLRRK